MFTNWTLSTGGPTLYPHEIIKSQAFWLTESSTQQLLNNFLPGAQVLHHIQS